MHIPHSSHLKKKSKHIRTKEDIEILEKFKICESTSACQKKGIL